MDPLTLPWIVPAQDGGRDFARDPEPGRIAWGSRPKGFGKDRAGHGPGVDLVLCPTDLVGTEKISSRWAVAAGRARGPNLACAGCGAKVGVWIGDCYTWLGRARRAFGQSFLGGRPVPGNNRCAVSVVAGTGASTVAGSSFRKGW